MESEIRNVGNSLGLILPAQIKNRLKLKAGDKIDLEINEENNVIIKPIPHEYKDVLLVILYREEPGKITPAEQMGFSVARIRDLPEVGEKFYTSENSVPYKCLSVRNKTNNAKAYDATIIAQII